MGNARHFGVGTLDIIPQPNFQATGNDAGRWEASQDFLVRPEFLTSFNAQQTLKEGTNLQALDPNSRPFWHFLTLASWAHTGREGGYAVITVDFTGYWSATYDEDPDAGRPVTYSLNGTLEEVSIIEHPKVVALTGGERAALSALLEGRAVWDVTNSKICREEPETGQLLPWIDQPITAGDGVTFAELITKGNISYKRPSITWTKHEETDVALTSSALNDLGRISTPDGDPPESNGSRDWMMISADSTQHGTEEPTYTNTITWLLSEREGWDADIYDT